ncbi:MAG: hypothetical protein LUQ46_00535 [Candidatus Methanomethyliaceae archaeon]|nr:hypothetical protein [Candidatus Methanomethyliaceae archaeon]
MPGSQMGYIEMGATTVGILCKDGVILASEKRISYGYTIMSKAGKKVFLINERIGIAFAGLISDAQAILRRLSAEIKLYELDYHTKMSVKSAAKLLSNILYSQRGFPAFAETIVGGVDEEGHKLYILDPLGSLMEDKFALLDGGQVCGPWDRRGSGYKRYRAGVQGRDVAEGWEGAGS